MPVDTLGGFGVKAEAAAAPTTLFGQPQVGPPTITTGEQASASQGLIGASASAPSFGFGAPTGDPERTAFSKPASPPPPIFSNLASAGGGTASPPSPSFSKLAPMPALTSPSSQDAGSAPAAFPASASGEGRLCF